MKERAHKYVQTKKLTEDELAVFTKKHSQTTETNIKKFVSGNLKWTPEVVIPFTANVLQWFIEHPGTLKIIQYWLDKDTDKTMPYRAFIEKAKQIPEAAEMFAVIKEIQELSILGRGLTKVYDSALSKFVLMNNHGWSDRTKQEVSVTNTNIEFTFGNPDDIIEAEIINDEEDGDK